MSGRSDRISAGVVFICSRDPVSMILMSHYRCFIYCDFLIYDSSDDSSTADDLNADRPKYVTRTYVTRSIGKRL